MQDVKGITLNIANKIYIPDGPKYSLAKEFQKKAIDIFHSEVQNINFGEAAKAASTINTWVFVGFLMWKIGFKVLMRIIN